MAIRSTNANRPARQREPWMDDPNAIRDRRNTPPPPGPPGGGSVWDWSNQEWTDMPNLNPRRPWSRTNPDGTRTGDPNERIDHFPGSASGEWNPNRYRMDENGNWVPRPTGYGGIPLNDDGKPIYTPDPTRYPEYFAPGSGRADTAEETRAYEEKKRQALAQDPEYVAAMQAAGQLSGPAALKARFAAEVAAKQRAQKQRYMTDYGMSEDTYDNRFNTSWPVPRSRNGQYWYRPPGAKGPNDPGVPGPTPPGVPPSRSQSSPPAYPPSAPAYPQSSSYPQSSAPQGNSMFQNYLGAVERPKANGGGASMSQYGGGGGTSARLDPSQFGGSSVNLDQLMGGGRNSMFEGYNPGQSKSGMGQNPMSGPAMSTGYPMGGGYMGNAMGASYGGGYNPMAGGMDFGGQGYSAAGGIPPQFLQMLMGGGGGFNPSSMLGGGRSMGYNPYAMLGMF